MSLPDLTVVVPTRNAESQVEACLAAIQAAEPAALIVVDGCSTDRTVALAQPYATRILSDEGGGLPVARLMGAEAARTRWVALIDVDVVVPDGVLGALVDELVDQRYDALQAGLHSTSGPGYWGRALAEHHRTGLSKNWFGLVATVAERDLIMEKGFDPRFMSGEDIELRWRLRHGGAKVGVSKTSVVEHRFAGDDWSFAASQFSADGYGIGLMVRKHRLRGLRLLLLPVLGAARGIALSALRARPQWIPYYAAYAALNYSSMLRALLRRPPVEPDRTAPAVE